MTARKCRICGATSGLRRLIGSPLSLDGAAWECDGDCPNPVRPVGPREPLDLDAIQARADAATDGPWVTGDRWRDGDVMHPWEVVVSDDLPCIEMKDDPQGRADAAFIADARRTVPRLVAELRAALAANERLQAMHREALDRNAPLAGEVREARAEIERLRALVRGVISLTKTTDGDELSPDAEIPVGELYRVLYVEPAPVLPERTAAPGEPQRCPNCAPGHDCESGIYTPDSPAAVDAELHRVAAELGEPIEIVRGMCDAIGACADEERIEREGNELEQTEFVLFDHPDNRRWWVLRGPAGAVSLTAVIVGDAELPPSMVVVRDRDGHRLMPDCFTAHRPGDGACPALPGGCDTDGEAISGARDAMKSWAATGHDDDVIRDALVDVYRRELLAGGERS